MALPEEYAIVRNTGITTPNIAYFLSRSVLFDGSTVLQVIIWHIELELLVLALEPSLVVCVYRVFLSSTN
jgi:hypothetical protein